MIVRVVTDEQLEEIGQEIQMREELEEVSYTNSLLPEIQQKLGFNITREETKQNRIALYKKMTDYGMFDPNKEITIVITFHIGHFVYFTTATVKENFAVTYDFCAALFNKHIKYQYRYSFFWYGIKDTDIIDSVDNGFQFSYKNPISFSPIMHYSNIKNIKENYRTEGSTNDHFIFVFEEFESNDT